MLGLLPTVLPCGGNLFLNLLATDRAGAGQHTGHAAGGCLGDDAFIVGVGVLRFLSFCLAASLAAAIVGDIVTAAHPAIPVMAEGGQLFFNDFTADRACILGGAVGCAGGVHPCALDLNILVLVGIGLEVRRQHHTAGIGVLRHRKAEGFAAVAAA